MNELRLRRTRPRNPQLRVQNRLRGFLNNPSRDSIDIYFHSGVNAQNSINALLNLFMPYVQNNEMFLLRTNGRNVMITQDFLFNLGNSILNTEITMDNAQGSDEEFIAQINLLRNFTIERIRPNPNRNQRVRGGFFNYLNNTDMNLESLAIYKDIKQENYEDMCFIYALKQGGLDTCKLNYLRTTIMTKSIPLCEITDICIKTEIKIKLKKIKENGEDDSVRYYPRIKDIKYKDLDWPEYELGCYNNHFFINKKLPYRRYHIQQLIKGKLKKNINSYKIKEDKQITSYNLVKLLLENKEKLLKPITYNKDILKTIHYDGIKEIIELDYEDKNFKETKKDYDKTQAKKKQIKWHKVFFDFETYRDYDNVNKPYLCCYIDENNIKKTFFGNDCGKQLLDSIPDNSLLIAHNANFDINFLIHYLWQITLIKKGAKIISCKAQYYDKKIMIKDSYLLISMPLRSFGACFNLTQHKEVMVYRLYDKYFQENNKNKYVDLQLAYEEIDNKENEELFYENCKKWNLLSEDKKQFDLIKYSAIYCMIDCVVLMNGYEKFREWIQDIAQMDTDEVLTLASLADQYFIRNDCYNDVYKMSGVAREFIQKCVVGGRCMVAKNKRYKLLNCKMADFDAVSLYPSAMKRLQEELGGYLIGKPKILQPNELNYDFLKKQDGYFVEITITELNIYRDFPLASFADGGVRNFSNEMVGKSIHIDKISLEDLIKWQDVKFEILRGYYFNEGRNPNIGKKIEYIFNERLKLKKQKNPAELVYKLLMNSAYGKTILNPVVDESKSFVDDTKNNYKAIDQMNDYIEKNYQNCKEYEKINDSHYILKTHKSILEHYSRPHCGVEILSMSKRIMHEVMATAEDHGIKIYYTDTDSMHILYEDVYKLEKIFNKKYNRELIGKNLGQFHVDFKLDGVPKENEDTIYAKNCIFLGKKTYIDQLVGLDKEGKEVSGYHIRAKGITHGAIMYECKKRGLNPFELYSLLFEGQKIEFDLLEGGSKINLKFDKFQVINNTSFTRSMHFV